MKNYVISLRRVVNFAILLALAVFIAIKCKSILVPVAFGALLAFMMRPVCNFFEKRLGFWTVPSILLSYLAVFIPVVAIGVVFSSQLDNVFQDMPAIREKINAGLDNVYGWFRNQFGYSKREAQKMFSEQFSEFSAGPLSFLRLGVNSSTAFLAGFLLTIVYAFLILLYRSSFKNFFLIQFDKAHREGAKSFIEKIQGVVQSYLYGVLLVVIIVGTLNTLGLWVIGIKHALFWGFLGSMLAVIPYIGTFIGGLLPFLYAIATTEEPWQPFAVAGLYILVQILEGNFITPNVVGSSVDVNPLAALLALIIGGEIWGIPGMILSLPFLAMLNEVLKQADFLKPVSLLLSNKVSSRRNLFEERYDEEKYRLRSFFKWQRRR